MPRIVRHGNAAPFSRSWAARSCARSSVEWRQRSASATASGCVYVSTGSTKVSVSQKTWPS